MADRDVFDAIELLKAQYPAIVKALETYYTAARVFHEAEVGRLHYRILTTDVVRFDRDDTPQTDEAE